MAIRRGTGDSDILTDTTGGDTLVAGGVQCAPTVMASTSASSRPPPGDIGTYSLDVFGMDGAFSRVRSFAAQAESRATEPRSGEAMET